MNKLFIVNLCDANHMKSTYEPIGYFEYSDEAVDAVIEHAANSEDGALDEDDAFLIWTIRQTQNRSENYIIEEVPLNVLL